LALPIDEALPELIAALRQSAGRAVLQAPPGAGKTTRVPLAMLEAGARPHPDAGAAPPRRPRRRRAHGANPGRNPSEKP
jgi:ATP-dependent helicase HrpB